jgi:hypothetical protein
MKYTPLFFSLFPTILYVLIYRYQAQSTILNIFYRCLYVEFLYIFIYHYNFYLKYKYTVISLYGVLNVNSYMASYFSSWLAKIMNKMI